MKEGITAEIIICSPAIFKGTKRNNVGELIQKMLDLHGVEVKAMKLAEGSATEIKEALDLSRTDFIIFSGGTSKKSKFVSIDVLSSLVDSRFLEMEEAIKEYGEKRSELAKRSTPLIGKKGKSVVMAIPGSSNGAKDALNVIFPGVLELF